MVPRIRDFLGCSQWCYWVSIFLVFLAPVLIFLLPLLGLGMEGEKEKKICGGEGWARIMCSGEEQGLAHNWIRGSAFDMFLRIWELFGCPCLKLTTPIYTVEIIILYFVGVKITGIVYYMHSTFNNLRIYILYMLNNITVVLDHPTFRVT